MPKEPLPKPTFVPVPKGYVPAPDDTVDNDHFGQGKVQSVVPRGVDDFKVTVAFARSGVGSKDLMWSVAAASTKVLASDVANRSPRSARSSQATQVAIEDPPLTETQQVNALIDWATERLSEKHDGATFDGFGDMIDELRARHGESLKSFQPRLEFIVRHASTLPTANVNAFFLRLTSAIESHPNIDGFKRAVAVLSGSLSSKKRT